MLYVGKSYYLLGSLTPFENLKLISEGQVRTQELETAEQNLHLQEIPPKVETCLLTSGGLFALGILVGVLFKARIGVVVSALGIFSIIGAFHQLSRQSDYEREVNSKLEQVSTIFESIVKYLDDLTGEKARTLIEAFNNKNLSSSQNFNEHLENFKKGVKRSI